MKAPLLVVANNQSVCWKARLANITAVGALRQPNLDIQPQILD